MPNQDTLIRKGLSSYDNTRKSSVAEFIAGLGIACISSSEIPKSAAIVGGLMLMDASLRFIKNSRMPTKRRILKKRQNKI